MDKELILIFIALNIANVIIQTVKSIATIKCGKGVAALVNAVAFGLYTIVTVYMLCDLDLWLKAGIVAGCNLVGVYVVKWAEEKARKDKLWKVEATIGKDVKVAELFESLKAEGVPFNYVDINKWYILNCYCSTQKQSACVKHLLDTYNAKYFVSETKTL